MHYNEYLRRYQFNIMALTWKRDSYGLYDYEVKGTHKQEFKFDISKSLIRVDMECAIEPLNSDYD